MEGDVGTTVALEPSVPAAKDNVLLEGWWVNIAALIVATVFVGLWHLLRTFVKKIMDKMDISDAEKAAIDALLQGMAQQQPIANGIKKAAADGKISKEEAKQLEAAALKTAKELATGPARDIVLSWGEEKVSSLIKQLLSKFKSRK